MVTMFKQFVTLKALFLKTLIYSVQNIRTILPMWILMIFFSEIFLEKKSPLAEGFNFFKIGFCKYLLIFLSPPFFFKLIIPFTYVYVSFYFFSGSLDFFFLTTHGIRINPEVKLMKNLFSRKGFCSAMLDFIRTLISQGSSHKTTSLKIFMKSPQKRSSSAVSSNEPVSKNSKD